MMPAEYFNQTGIKRQRSANANKSDNTNRVTSPAAMSASISPRPVDAPESCASTSWQSKRRRLSNRPPPRYGLKLKPSTGSSEWVVNVIELTTDAGSDNVARLSPERSQLSTATTSKLPNNSTNVKSPVEEHAGDRGDRTPLLRAILDQPDDDSLKVRMNEYPRWENVIDLTTDAGSDNVARLSPERRQLSTATTSRLPNSPVKQHASFLILSLLDQPDSDIDKDSTAKIKKIIEDIRKKKDEEKVIDLTTDAGSDNVARLSPKRSQILTATTSKLPNNSTNVKSPVEEHAGSCILALLNEPDSDTDEYSEAEMNKYLKDQTKEDLPYILKACGLDNKDFHDILCSVK